MIEPDEVPEAAARREALEEAGVVVELTARRTTVGGPGSRITAPNGEEILCVAIVFDAVVASGSPNPDHDETTEVGWFSLAELDLVTSIADSSMKSCHSIDRRALVGGITRSP